MTKRPRMELPRVSDGWQIIFADPSFRWLDRQDARQPELPL